jgi:3-methyl-2-oxobutanoate hydroxymethyltransferase
MPAKVTAPSLLQKRLEGIPAVCVTAYDVLSGALCDQAGVDVVLVGDSVGNTVLGYTTTVPVTLDEMLHHVRAVRRGVEKALLVADLPFGTYEVSKEQALESSIALMKAGAEAVKLEGPYSDAIRHIVKAGIPVMGHVGMTPQSVHSFGGFRVQGRGESGNQVLEDAKVVEEAGAFAVVLELIPGELAAQITDALKIPTIGIGAGNGCSGQIQVFHDIMGLSEKVHKHAKLYAHAREQMANGLAAYAQEVRSGEFPRPENTF